MEQLAQGLQAAAGVFVLASFLALVNERINEFVFKRLLLIPFAPEIVADLIPYISVVSGAGISIGFGADLFMPLAQAFSLEPASWLTMALTAVLVGGGSNLLHDVWPSNAS